MTGDVLLDTNIVIALLAVEAQVVQRISTAPMAFLPAIVVGELCFGARKSSQAAANLMRIDEFAARSTVLECDLETARLYGEIKHQLRTRGTPIPDNDIWIAAIAQQHQLQLLTRDAHFKHVAGLDAEYC